MKKLFILLLALFFITPISAHASTTVTLTAPSHRHLDGTFFDDALATDLLPDGKYGDLIFHTKSFVGTWKIDPSFLEDVHAMASGYQVSGIGEGKGKEAAIAFMDRLKIVTSIGRIEALPYSNPSEYWVSKFMPHDRVYILDVSASRLSSLLGRFTYAPTQYASKKYFSLTSPQIRLINLSTQRIQSSASYLDSQLLENYKLSQVKLLSVSVTQTQRQAFAYDLAAQLNSLRNSIRVSRGKFTITSASQKLPITLTNDFPKPVVVNLSISTINQRIFVDDIKSISIPAKSKMQVLIPVKAYTSGDSGFTVTLETKNGSVFGQTTTYPLKVAFISPVATWITTIAAIILFGAAILKSIRRFRRGGKSHEHR